MRQRIFNNLGDKEVTSANFHQMFAQACAAAHPLGNPVNREEIGSNSGWIFRFSPDTRRYLIITARLISSTVTLTFVALGSYVITTKTLI